MEGREGTASRADGSLSVGNRDIQTLWAGDGCCDDLVRLEFQGGTSAFMNIAFAWFGARMSAPAQGSVGTDTQRQARLITPIPAGLIR